MAGKYICEKRTILCKLIIFLKNSLINRQQVTMDMPSDDVVLYSAIALIIVENFVEIYFFHRVSPK